MTPKEKAQQLYRDAYMRWSYELSQEKNHLMAKSIATYVVDQILLEREVIYASLGYPVGKFWYEVKEEIQNIRG
jgi:hypothetical protein